MPESQPALSVEKLSYSFKNHRALSDVSFTVGARSIHGFVGPNGAGKTTALKCIATLLTPKLGKVKVFGTNVTQDQRRVRRRIGFMPDHLSMYRQMTVYEYLDFFAAAYGQPVTQRNRAIRDVLALTDIESRQKDLIKGLSRGMQQRLSLARVLVHDPDLLLLDEPASGLDPRARIELMAILEELRRLGKTIFISSHILSELSTLCDSVTIIDRGGIRYSGSMDGLLADRETQDLFNLALAEPCEGLEAKLRTVTGVMDVVAEENGSAFQVRIDAGKTDSAAILRAALDHGARISSFNREMKQLNQVFMDLTTPGISS